MMFGRSIGVCPNLLIFFLYYVQADLYSNSQGDILALPGFILWKI